MKIYVRTYRTHKDFSDSVDGVEIQLDVPNGTTYKQLFSYFMSGGSGNPVEWEKIRAGNFDSIASSIYHSNRNGIVSRAVPIEMGATFWCDDDIGGMKVVV